MLGANATGAVGKAGRDLPLTREMRDLQELIVAGGSMAHHDLLRITVEPLEDAHLIRAAGEIDLSSVAALRRELDAARAEAVTVLLDLSGVTFIDSSGLHLLLHASHSSAVSDWDFFVVR